MLFSILLYSLIVFFSLGQLGRVSFFGQQINFYLYEILVLLITLVLFLNNGLKPLKDSFKKFKAVYFFLIFLIISFFLNLQDFKRLENFIGFLYIFRLLIYFAYFFYLLHYLKKKPQFAKVGRNGFLFFIFLTTTISVLQYFLYPDLRNLLYAGWDPHLYRLFGTFFDTSVAGAVYGLIFLFLLMSGKNFIKNISLKNILLVTFTAFIVLTFSRSLYIVIVSITILATTAQRWYRKLVLFIVIFLLLVIIAPKPFGEGINLVRTFSIESRINDYRAAIKIWQKKPFFGFGYNRIRYVKRQMNVVEEFDFDIAHSGASFNSSFLIILVAGGLVGFGLFGGVLYQFARLTNEVGYYTLFVALLSLTDNIFLHPFILFLFFSLILLSRFNPSRRLQ